MWRQCPELNGVYTSEGFDLLLKDEERLHRVYAYMQREVKNHGYDTRLTVHYSDFTYDEMVSVLRQERDDLEEKELMESVGFEYRFTRHYCLSLERGDVYVHHDLNGEITIVLRKGKEKLSDTWSRSGPLLDFVVEFLKENLVADDYGRLPKVLKDLIVKGVHNGAERKS